MKEKIVLMFSLLALCGCSALSHSEQILTLKSLADEQDKMGKYVEKQDQKFEQMLAEQKAGTLDQYLGKEKILRTFGKPIYVKHVKRDDQELETWLYRYATEFFGSEKIYLYFDSEEQLIESEYIKEEHGKVR